MKNSQNGFIIPIVILIIAALAIGGGAYVYTRNINADQPPIIKKGVYISKQTNGQVTYKSDEYGLEFTLPSTFTPESRADNAFAANDIFYAKGTHREIFRIYPRKKLFIAQAGYVQSGIYVKDPWKISVGNKTGDRFYTEGEICTASQDVQVGIKDSSSRNQNIVISIWGGDCAGPNIDQSIIDSILASFKFDN